MEQLMRHDNDTTLQISQIGELTFTKLKELRVPPYPKYYHDTFMDELLRTKDPVLIELSQKYSHLFSADSNQDYNNDKTIEIAKDSLQEFAKSNSNLKVISDKNIIDVNAIRQDDDKINTAEILRVFDSFQREVLSELQSADETITRLELEVEKLERESHIDPLTKAYNRRVLNKDLQEILTAIQDKSNDLNLIMFDADDFKKVNDLYGHIAGDKTLIFISKMLQSSVRQGTKLYRYGGEEFIIVLNRTTLDETIAITGRILKEIDESKLLYKGHNIHLTLSAGISSYVAGDTAESLIERADRALYDAKDDGKNCLKVGE